MPSRRQVLGLVATAAAGSFAGCATPGGALSMTAVGTDAAIGEAATTMVDPDRAAETAALLDDAADNGSADIDAERPPLDPARPVRWRDAIYDVTWAVTDERTRTVHRVIAEPAEADATGSRIAFEELPSVDRDRLDAHRDVLIRTVDEDERLAVELEYGAADAVDASVLVPTSAYDLVIIDDRPVAVQSRETETSVSTYTYELAERSPSPAAYGSDLRERLVVLRSLDDDERALVEEAIADGTAVVGTNDEAFIGVGERLLEHEPISIEDRVGEWLVAYDGNRYWTELDTLRTSELVDQLEAYDE